MKKLITIALVLLLLVAIIVPQTGCKGGTEEVEPAPSESNRWLELLSVLPANENTLKAGYLQDFAYLKEKVGEQTTPEYLIFRQHHLSGYTARVVLGEPPADEEWK